MDLPMEKDPIEKLKYLIGNFNSLRSNIDLYSKFIRIKIDEKKQVK